MTSSMLSGERRWASSSRRGGMTVLGKVAVPKPINLPSQRLENHGLDPNVEIVPKGTHSWGSRSSSSTSNAWGSSSLSPNTDGGASSPSHLSARPSSGGSGTRPSTAGSDRVLEPTSNSWGSNSRPSSASGVLSKNQSLLTSLRPRSAETRPGSSQLSRFAEPLTENSGAWNAAKTTEKLGVTQPKNEEFSLSSGDFPTLGSDKDKSVLNFELQDQNSQAHPDSSSELRKELSETPAIDDDPVNANIKGGTVNSWRRDYQVYNEEGVRPGIEKWQGNSQLYPNAGVPPPQHYDAWHGPPVNNPQGCVWFRGPPSGPPFGNPVTPGGFPMEPFPYYRPHMPPAGLANPPPVPPPGAGPRGHHKNGDVYRPHIADAFIRPGIPMRPGFYPGSMTYEGYYSPPMGYCNANERDVPFMGMAAGPPVYNRYSNQNPPEPGNSQGRSAGYGNAGKQLTSEQVESGHPPDTAGPYRVLLKQQPESDVKNESANWEDSEKTNAAYVDGRGQPRMTVWENEQRSNYRKNEETDLRKSTHGEVSSQTSENQVSSSSVIKGKTPESSGNIKFDDNSARKLDGVASDMPEVSPKPSAPKDASLIQKIEGLNAKARDNSSARIREEQRSKFHTSNAAIDHVENTVGADVVFQARTHATEIINPAHHEMGAAGAGNFSESLSFSGTAMSRQSAHGMQGRGDHRNKGRSNNQDADGWRKKSVVEDSSASSGVQLEASNVLVGDHQISVQTYDRSGSYNQARHIGEPVQTLSDSGDSHAQRAKKKELALQRTRQLQEEEEERTRKQKAKARAKLDELNKRSQAGDGSTQKEYITNPQLQEEEEEEWTRKQKANALAKLDELNKQPQAGDGSTQKEYITNPAIQNKPEELQPSESKTAAGKFAAVNSAVNCNAMCQIHDPSISRVEKSPVLPGEPTVETLKNFGKEPILKHNQVVALHQDINNADDANPLHAHNNVASKQKRMSYKQKQNLPFEKTSSDKVVSTTSTALKVENEARVDVSLPSGGVTNEVGSACGSDLPMNLAAVVESSANLKKKNIRNSKNKQKHEESSTQAVLPIPKETNLFKSSVESDKSKASGFESDQGVLQPAPLSKDPSHFPEQHRYSANEESHGRTNSQWKSQHSRRLPRNMQANRPAEKSHGTDAVMWAPVKPQNKSEIMDESVENSKTEPVNPVKNEQQVHNLKNKRAEMERYIPKPVAKEMAQQGNILQVASSSTQALTDDSIGRVDSGSQAPQVIHHTNPVVAKVGFGMESKIRDGRHTKQGKAHGSWRQRNLTESTNVHDELDHDSNSEPSVHKPTEHHHEPKSEVSFVKGGQTKDFSDSGEIDGSNNTNCNDSAAWASAPVKDLAATGRGRRAPFRGHKGAGGNREVDNKRNFWEAEKVETLISSSEHGQPDVGMASKENRGVGERLTSQWQPKSQASNNHRWNISTDQNVSSVVVGGNKKDPTHDGESLPVSRGKSSNAHVSQPFHDQPVSEKSKAGEAHHFGNQEGKKERRNAPTKRHHYSPNLASVTSVEQAPTSADLLQDQRPSSGSGKNVNQNRFRRGHESHGNLKPPTQDNRHYNQPTNRERQGPSMHHEYHPLGPYDDGKLDNFERPKNGNHGERRFRERGPTHSRRGGGNSYGRQGGFESYD